MTQEIQAAAERAHPIFVAHGWKWGGLSTPQFIPSVAQIASTFEHLSQIIAEGSTQASTGRLMVMKDELVDRRYLVEVGSEYVDGEGDG